MQLHFYNDKLQRYDDVKVSNFREDTIIIDYAIKLYGNDFYLLIQHGELEYSLNSDIICTISF